MKSESDSSLASELVSLEPPHDHLGTQIGPWLPKEPMLREMMEENRRNFEQNYFLVNALSFRKHAEDKGDGPIPAVVSGSP